MSSAAMRGRAVLLATALCLLGCSGSRTEHDFVGKWKSSRLTTPIYLHENGEWEIVGADGALLEYGVWQYGDGSILWTFKQNSGVLHDRNPVLSVAQQEFRLKEQNGEITTFTRLE